MRVLRRLIAALGMLAILGLLAVLVYEVYEHRNTRSGEPAIVVTLANQTELIA